MDATDIPHAYQHKQQDPPAYRDGGRRHAPAAGGCPTPVAPRARRCICSEVGGRGCNHIQNTAPYEIQFSITIESARGGAKSGALKQARPRKQNSIAESRFRRLGGAHRRFCAAVASQSEP
jgi:hypothetical protein